MIHVISSPSSATLDAISVDDVVILKGGCCLDNVLTHAVVVVGQSREPWIANTLAQVTSPGYMQVFFFHPPSARIPITVHALPEEFNSILADWRKQKSTQDFKLFFV